MGKLQMIIKNIPSIIKQPKLIFAILSFFIVAVFSFSYTAFASKSSAEDRGKTLGVENAISPTATPTTEPTTIPTAIPTIAKIKNIYPTPTSGVVINPTPTQSPAKSSSSNSTSNPASDSSPTPTATPTPTSAPQSTTTPTPTVVQSEIAVTIGVEYAGQKNSDSYSVKVSPNQSVWEAVQKAIGVSNLQYTDYGGSMGIFITGLNGVAAAANQYYEFRVNGVSSDIGISSYVCKDGDRLDFILTAF